MNSMKKQPINPEVKSKIEKIVDESIKLTLFDKLITLQKEFPNDAEFGKEVRKLISIIK